MQVNNTNNYQPSFGILCFEQNAKKSAEKILKERMSAKELDSFFKAFEESPVKVTFGLADGFADRLDATIDYQSNIRSRRSPSGMLKSFSYISENRFLNLFNFKPKKFLQKTLLEVRTIEETFQIGKYAE